MKRLIAFLFALTVMLSGVTVLYEIDRLGVEQVKNVQLNVELKDTFVKVEPPTYRDRLEFQVSRGEIRALDMTITAYDLSYDSCEKHPEHPEYGITASGEYVREGFVAVDPDVIPLHTRLYIDGYGIVVAKDVGGAIVGNRLDIFMPSKEDCKKWGVQKRRVYILGKE